VRPGDRDFDGLIVEESWVRRVFNVALETLLFSMCVVVLALVLWFAFGPAIDKGGPATTAPNLSEIDARNIEVLRQALEDECGKQITFMAEHVKANDIE